MKRLVYIIALCLPLLTTVSAQGLLYTSAYSGNGPARSFGTIGAGQDGLCDFDADGVSDTVTSVEERQGGRSELVGLILSGETGDVLGAVRVLAPTATYDGPRDLRPTPDVTGDGVPDIWSLIPNENGNALALASGAAVLSGAENPFIAILESQGAQGTANGYIDDLLATGLDATGDGVSDLLALTSGSVRLYSGAAVAAGDTAPVRVYTSPDTGATITPGRFAVGNSRIAFVPDLDGDGRAEVAISDESVIDAGDDGFGRIYIYSGGTLLHVLDEPLGYGPPEFDTIAVGGMVGPGAGGDIDGDGVPDLAVGSWGKVHTFSGATGEVIAVYGDGACPGPGQPCEFTGGNLRAVPDTDDDGVADLAYWIARRGENNAPLPDAVAVISSVTGAELFRVVDPAVIPTESGLGSGFGQNLVGSLGDADGDGLWDLVVSAPNAGGMDSTPGPGRVYAFTRMPVSAEPSAEAERLALSASPNPSRGAAAVSFRLPSAQRVRLTLHDALGREVARLADGVRAAGPHRVATPAGLAPGVYLARLAAGGAVATRTLAVVR